ncbi:MAG: acyltransferase [Ferruginibacter sp.]
MKGRIRPLDGLRALAVLGVIWIHSWSYCGNPSLKLASVDIYKMIAIAGNGVDFFFVISGFCMYLLIDKSRLTLKKYGHFFYKRFLRIAPPFFISVLVYAIILKALDHSFDFWYNVLFHLLFLNNVVTGNVIYGPFWSIGVEWHFYIILPFMITLINHFSAVRAVLLISMVSIFLYSIAILGQWDMNWWENQIIIRFPEFGCGIIAADFYLKGKKIPSFLSGSMGLLLGLSIMYLGRCLMYTPLLITVGKSAFFLKAISYTVMTSGFAFILFHVISIPSIAASFLSNTVLNYLGKISYSIYLWHGLSFTLLTKYFDKWELLQFKPLLVFSSVTLLTIFIAHFSYQFLESFYFKRSTNNGGQLPVQK